VQNQIKSMLLFYGVEIPEAREMGHCLDDLFGGSRGFGWNEPPEIRLLKFTWKKLHHLRQILAKLNRAILALSRTKSTSLGELVENRSGSATLRP